MHFITHFLAKKWTLNLFYCLTLFFSSIGYAEEMAPDFKLDTLDGSQTISLSGYRGRVVYLDFWASWCPPCLVSIPQYAEWSKELNKDEALILTINLDKSPKRALSFLKKHEVPFTVLSDKQGNTAKAYNLPSMPSSYIIDQNGKIVFRHSGFKNGDLTLIKQELKKYIND